jgi:hypothetical protein
LKTAFAVASLCLALMPRPASAEATMDDIGASVAKIVGRVSSNWTWETTAPIVLPLTRNPANFEDALGKGRALGELETCTGRLDPLDKIPNAVKYSGQCRFKHGQARVYLGFGVGKDGEPVLIALGVFPNEGTPDDYAEVAPDPAAGPVNAGGTVNWREESADAAAKTATGPAAAPAKATEATASPEDAAKPATKP